MPWLIFRDVDDKYLRARSSRGWTTNKHEAAKFPTRPDAEQFILHYKVPDKVYYIELTKTELYGRENVGGARIQATKRVPITMSAVEMRRRKAEAADSVDPREINARRLAVHLLLFTDLPGGYVNRRCIANRGDKMISRAIGIVADKIMRGTYRYGELPVRRSPIKDATPLKQKYGRVIDGSEAQNAVMRTKLETVQWEIE